MVGHERRCARAVRPSGADHTRIPDSAMWSTRCFVVAAVLLGLVALLVSFRIHALAFSGPAWASLAPIDELYTAQDAFYLHRTLIELVQGASLARTNTPLENGFRVIRQAILPHVKVAVFSSLLLRGQRDASCSCMCAPWSLLA